MDLDDVGSLRQELNDRLQQQYAMEQDVEQRMHSFMLNERDLAQGLIQEFRVAGSEVLTRQSEQAGARLAESQEQLHVLAREVHNARQGELQGESLVRHVEQVAQAQLDSQQQQLQEVAVVHERERDQLAAEMQQRLVEAQGQQHHQQAFVAQAHAEVGHAQHEYEVMQGAYQESQRHISDLHNEMQAQAAQVEQLTTMLQSFMQQNSEHAGRPPAERQAGGEDVPSSKSSSFATSQQC